MPTSLKIHNPPACGTVIAGFPVAGSVFSTTPNVMVRVSINDMNGNQVAQNVVAPTTDPTTGIGLWSIMFAAANVPPNPNYEAVAIAFAGGTVLASNSCNFTVIMGGGPQKKKLKGGKKAKAVPKKAPA